MSGRCAVLPLPRTAIVVVCCLLARASALTFHLGPEQSRCISEDIPAKSLLAGDWAISDETGSRSPPSPPPEQGSGGDMNATLVVPFFVTVSVRNPDGMSVFHNVHEEHGPMRTGHFAVTAGVAGLYSVCVDNTHAVETQRVSLNIKTAVEVKSGAHDTVAKKEHIDGIEKELDRMKKMAVHVYEEMLFMRERSEQQHATNESTRVRLLWLELAMMAGVIAMGVYQIKYLRVYFRQKKLI